MLLSALRDNALHYLLMYTYCLTLMVWKLNVRHGPDVPIDEYEVWLCRSWVSVGQKVDGEVFWTTATKNLKWVTCIHTQDPALTLSCWAALSTWALLLFLYQSQCLSSNASMLAKPQRLAHKDGKCLLSLSDWQTQLRVHPCLLP